MSPVCRPTLSSSAKARFSARFLVNGLPGYSGRHQDVFQCSIIFQQMEGLKDKSDLFIPQGGSVRWGDFAPVDEQPSLAGIFKRPQDLQQCAFALSGAADNGDRFSRLHLQRDPFEDRNCFRMIERFCECFAPLKGCGAFLVPFYPPPDLKICEGRKRQALIAGTMPARREMQTVAARTKESAS